MYAVSAMGLALERFFFVLNLGGRVRGGFEFWRGNIFARGVSEQGSAGIYAKQGGADGGAFGQTAAGGGLLECLPANAKSGGALSGAGVEGA